ncbi:SAM-dependent methyltransferase [Streptomyces sp. NPDC059740]|uniref:SAM-dependent methyltransferase n=1 Tax=Streptomyces sp. NPDC059740 TaxID=3346926 RepID=UPI00365F3E38
MKETEWMVSAPSRPVDLRQDQPHAARVYDVLLGGKTNYAADRAQAEKIMANIPQAVASARSNRAFVLRAARFLADSGIRQFLDIGTGIPTSPNLHEVAQSITPSSRVVYADNDPIVLAHSRALHDSHPEGRTAYLEADACDVDAILTSPEVRETLDLDEPVALTLCLLLHWLPKNVDPYPLVRRFLAALPAGSYLVLSHLGSDFTEATNQVEKDFEEAGSNVRGRTREEVLRFFDGLELVSPGVVVPQMWRPDPIDVGSAAGERDVPIWAGVARKDS